MDAHLPGVPGGPTVLGYTGEVDTPPGCGLTALTLSEPARSSKRKMGLRQGAYMASEKQAATIKVMIQK